jgi:hypothetical protein
MPEYILPALKESKGKNSEIETYDPETEDRWFRQIRIPVNKEIIDALAIGDVAELTLKGKIISLESRETEKGKGRKEIEIELSSVEAYPENEFSELADD